MTSPTPHQGLSLYSKNMKLSVKDILSFCIDRGLRQFHLNCKWGITNNAGDIPDEAKTKIKESKADFFENYNYFVILKTNGGEDAKKISNLVAKSLTGADPQADDEGFVQMASDSTAIAGIKIDDKAEKSEEEPESSEEDEGKEEEEKEDTE